MSDVAMEGVFERAMQRALAVCHARAEYVREAGPVWQWSDAELASAVASDAERGTAIVGKLLNEAWSERSADHARSYALADRAFRCLVGFVETREQVALLARALRIRGNASRIQGELAASEADLVCAIDLSEEGWDPFGLGQGRRFLSTVHYERGQFATAEGLATRAIVNFRMAQDPEEELETRLCRGRIRSWGGMPRAMSDFAAVLDRTRSLPRAAMAAHNAVDHLARHGHFKAATELLELAAPFYAAVQSRVLHSHRDWLRGRIALGRGQYADAEWLLEGAIRDCEAQGRSIDAAEATLELCCVYAAQGRWRLLVRCARAAGELLAAAGVADAHLAVQMVASVRRQAREAAAASAVAQLQRAILEVRARRWRR